MRKRVDRFKAGWYFLGGKSHLHWIAGNQVMHMTHCGIAADPKRIYTGYGTKQCPECLKMFKENGKVKR